MVKIGWTNTQPAVMGLILLTLVFFVVVGSVSAAEVTVGPLQSAIVDNDNILDAVTSSSNGDVITLMSGTYKGVNNRDITINKNITIQGAAYAKKGTGKTIIDGEGKTIFDIDPSAIVNIYGITFMNSGANSGVVTINNYGTLNVKNCEFADNGLAIRDCGKLELLSSNFTRNMIGVQLTSEGALIKSCNFINNGFTFEVLKTASYNTINYNRFVENGYDIISDGFATNLDFNWWGNNAGIIKSFGTESIVKNVYFMVQLDADKNVALTNKAVNYPGGELANLGYSLTTNIPVSFERNALPSFDVYLTLPNGRTITINSNTDYNYALTGFRNQNFVFRLKSDNEAFGFSVHFVGGITPSIQPSFGVFFNPGVFADSNKYNYNPFSEESDDSVNKKVAIAGPESGAYNANTNGQTGYGGNIKTVNAEASMKGTGIPIIGMILGLLAVLGVFVKGKD